MAAGERIVPASIGFLLTGVGLPLLTVVALARVGGGMDRLTAPLGRWAGLALAVAVYLAIGPLFATPRTATVSFEMGIAPFAGNSAGPLFIYTSLFFLAVLLLVLNPGRLIDRVGKFITPVLLAALLVLGCAALFAPAGPIGETAESYRTSPLLKGFLDGYLTMDALGALVFGIVIATAIRDRGVTEPALVTRYSMIAGVIAAIGLSLVYLALFYLGATSQGIAGDASNGVQILTTYVQHTCGSTGSLLLAVRVGLYPLAIVLVALSLLDRLWVSPRRIFVPTMAITLIFGVVDGFAAAGFDQLVPELFKQLPLAAQGMGWLLPVLVTLLAAIIADRVAGTRKTG